MLFRRLILAVLAATGLAIGAAVPAFASTAPTQANVMVNSTISCTASTAFIITGNAGATVQASAPVAVTVSTNDALGATVTSSPSGDLSDGAGHSIPTSDFSVQQAKNGGTPGPFTAYVESPAVFQVDKTTAAGSNSYSDLYELAIPPTAAAATYLTNIVYQCVGN